MPYLPFTFYLIMCGFVLVPINLQSQENSPFIDRTDEFISTEELDKLPLQLIEPVDAEQWKAWLHEYQTTHKAITLFEQPTLDAPAEIQRVIYQLTKSLQNGKEFMVTLPSRDQIHPSSNNGEVLNTFSKWVDLNSEALKQVTGWRANTLDSNQLTHFTTDDEFIYCFIHSPQAGWLSIYPLGKRHFSNDETIQYINIVGCGSAVSYEWENDALRVKIPKQRVTGDYTLVLRIAGLAAVK